MYRPLFGYSKGKTFSRLSKLLRRNKITRREHKRFTRVQQAIMESLSPPKTGANFSFLRKLLRSKKITTKEYCRLSQLEHTFVGITQRFGYRKVLKALYRGYYALHCLYQDEARKKSSSARK